jgi:RNA polymerase sigma factor (sigma-70 family)
MTDAPPQELTRLLNAAAAERDRAWESFVATHHRLLLHVARAFVKEQDAAMDAFTWILDHLRADEFHRLRGFTADGRSEFTTWLVVVARRLCLDWYRSKYGRDRSRSTDAAASEDRTARRRLIDLVGDDVDTSELPHASGSEADVELQTAELGHAVQAALAELDPSDRLLLKLRFDDGMSGADIADFMRFPTPFHVYRRITHLLESLRRTLISRGVEGPVP